VQQLISILDDRRDDPRPALIFEGSVLSYADLCQAVGAMAERLRSSGVTPGQKVLVSLSNSPAFALGMLALSEVGAVSIPLNPSMPEKERARVLAIARPQFALGLQGQHRLMPGVYIRALNDRPDGHEPELEDVSTIVFTSGTTGAPKGVLLSGDALLTNSRAVVDYLGLTPADRTLIFLPLYYSYPMSQLLSTWIAGGTVVLMKNLMFPAEAMKLIDRHGVTGLGGVPTSLSLLANQTVRPQQPPRYVMSAGGPLAPVLVRRLNAVFPGAALFNNYGCTEIGPRATAINYADHPQRIGSIGRAIAGVDVRLIKPDLSEAAPMETAEIVLNGPSLMKGYYRDPDTTAQRMSRWGFHTGDYAHADDDGFLYFEGRHDDVFKSGGEKVSAREIEDVMLEHPGVLEVAVVAQPDPLLGYVSVAYVVRSDESGPTQQDLQVFCRRKLSFHKVPQAVHFLARLERTDTGKVQKFRLKEAVQGSVL